MYTKILGTGSYLPTQIRSNTDLANMVDTSDEWIIARTGIRERRIASANETVFSMGSSAAEQALHMAGISANKVGMIIVATTSSSHAFPSSACQIQRDLGIMDCVAFDLAAACAGFPYALSIVDQYIKNGVIEYALVIGSDVLSNTPAPDDRSTLILFGDGAGAVLVGCSEQPGILSTHLHADGSYSDLLTLPYYNRFNPTADIYLKMSGNEVFKIAVTKLAHLVDETMSINHLSSKEIDWLVPHQANLRIISATAKLLGMKMNKVIVTLDKHGNTSAASIPLALDEAVRDGRIKTDQLLLLEAFGGGLTWGSALLRF
ncbi:beta-ketoacyl-ACP synthase III [Candidatus Palibaumannia cicadellinicola]|uniref:Beta-ketoacyl-[acyl-carrier-protein] synthase III n=1 Tax=Baumannia cicadellinicola subsp. Homalodisca coagulata TaxID=374463 RepID=FABH_BAUCH|nr:beta-ketoacyl-ACP synthase III [Candidatus Baumannia cicadellinicola]Q1LT37.1 RecName: Full=Beta-ketoacyl-[acyl-carrier-protein] synthase III; Short=Beta-ketoacyl-ACP synthase III; Short=KAS III; AltName: Full=3-oxoacyl-[acyl-carrier-protein] synthase 3; AltName: Full=3-oxoacyl-[acyl-carrier-protein] synthase III [Baumannia cicadellinicola str. Hc (Homalodisca coagulata)]ABF14152.1 3-oxoacyl-[acyl-carrier-protein] synthase III [Baumannia cicadellinicola str. Hc (Homalodisca coagulata)]MBS0032